jgi:hypothetical protein
MLEWVVVVVYCLVILIIGSGLLKCEIFAGKSPIVCPLSKTIYF